MAKIKLSTVLDVARRLVALMYASELEIARVIEPQLFPTGTPTPLTGAELLRAQAAMVARSAEEWARADIAENAARMPPDELQPDSFLSQEVAEKVAQSAELERMMAGVAGEMGQELEQHFFPRGLPESATFLDFLQSLRIQLEDMIARVELGGSRLTREERTRFLKDTRSSIRFYLGFCDLAGEDEVVNELEELAEL